MSEKIDAHEREVIQDLLDDFAVESSLTAEQVYRISWEKFNVLESATDLQR